MVLTIKDYNLLYNTLQELIVEQLVIHGANFQVVGRWPLYSLLNTSKYPIKQICEFFNKALQHNEQLLTNILNDVTIKLNDLKHELESIQFIVGDDALSSAEQEQMLLQPTPTEKLKVMVETLLKDPSKEPPQEVVPPPTTTTIELPPPQIEEFIQEEFPEMLNTKFQELDAIFDLLQDQLFLHPKFKEMVDGLPEKIMALFQEHGELTVKEVIVNLNLDVSVRGVRVAFVVAWQQVENQLINAESLI